MTGEELRAALQAVSAQARAHMPQSAIDVMEASIARLADSGIADQALKAGDTMPDFVLPDAFGADTRSVALRREGPLIISFYRGGWCPYCSIELGALQAHLPAFKARGASLVAISPQTADNSLSTQQKLDLGYPVLSDVGNTVARRFGIVFTLEEALRPLYTALGVDLPAANGDASFELPMPATYVVARDGKVLKSFVSADFRERLAPEEILSALDGAS